MQSLHQQLNDNLQLIFRKAIDADAAIDNLQQQGKGKFTQIFSSEAGFETNAKRFGPYVEELTINIEQLKQMDENELGQSLPVVIKKMELMFATLAEFKTSLKS